MLSESVELIGKGLYKTVPDVIEIIAVPTATELEYVSAENFDSTMVKSVLPKVIENSDSMDLTELLAIDYDWICRCLRMKSYGPYVTTNRIYCPNSGVHKGEYEVDLRMVPITPLPNGFVNSITISKDEFIDVKDDITFSLLTVQDQLLMSQDKMFDTPNGPRNNMLATLCYSIKSIGDRKAVNPVDVKSYINNNISAADYELLKDLFKEKTNYGLHLMGYCTCPVCGAKEAYFVASQADMFFRPSVGDVRKFRDAVRSGDWEKLPGNPTEYVR